MKYLCLICADKMMEDMSDADADQHYQDYAAFTESLRQNGQLLSCNRLMPPETATTVRVRGGRVSITDGPFAETKEQIGGYFVIEARNQDEAILVASKIPGAWHGCVEVRRIAEDEQTLLALGLDVAK
jgi:hypothetical protein